MYDETQSIFHTFTHYGKRTDHKFSRRLKHSTEHIEAALQFFDETLTKKLKKKGGFELLPNGVMIFSLGLSQIFSTDAEVDNKPVKPTKRKAELKQEPTYRKLRV